MTKFNVKLFLQFAFLISAPLSSADPRLPVNTEVEFMRIYNGFVRINCCNDQWCYILILL